MNCPVCKNISLQNKDLGENLTAQACQHCEGLWIPSSQYWQWSQTHPAKPDTEPTPQITSIPAQDSVRPKLCPECGHFLTRKKVGHGVAFSLERCTSCGGIWLDKNEWETLRSRNLHTRIHFIFSDSWQKQVQQQENREIHEKRIEQIIGRDDYKKLQSVAGWIHSHPQKATILSYIIETNE
jgi:Zn-finger nucleic acid-binding protein